MHTTERPEVRPGRRGGVLASLSLEYKLPVLIAALLLAVTIALSAAAYVETRHVTLAAASSRLQAVTGQFRDLLRQQAAQMRAQTSEIAAKPELAAFVRSRSVVTRDQALEALEYAGPSPEQVIAVELRNGADSVLLSTAPNFGTDTISTRELTRTTPTLGAFHALRDTMVYASLAPVVGTDVVVVQWRRLTATRRGREELARLIGSDARVLIGNADSSRWGDFENLVAAPPADARVERIPNTLWSLAVHFPREGVLMPVRDFMRRMALIAAGALALGLLVTWFASRRITTPLRQLTTTARSISRGDLSPPRTIARADELGQLSNAIALMAGEVRASREGLEAKVEERTKELNVALEQLKDAQDALVRREKLAMLGQLAGGIGHELRNPLGVMTNAVYYLKVVLAGQPATVHEYLEILQQQITLSEKIVSDLMDFARSKPPQRSLASLTEVTSSQINRLGPTEGVRLDTHLPADLPPVLVDRIQIGQVVLNLLTNALQAVEGTGTITVSVGAEGNRAHVEVTDSGPGVASENLERIFEPLFTTKARGIGLGLAVSRTLSRANEGDLTVSSPPGRGATFRLELPTGEARAT